MTSRQKRNVYLKFNKIFANNFFEAKKGKWGSRTKRKGGEGGGEEGRGRRRRGGEG